MFDFTVTKLDTVKKLLSEFELQLGHELGAEVKLKIIYVNTEAKPKIPSPDTLLRIVEVVCERWSVSAHELYSKGKAGVLPYARFQAWALIRHFFPKYPLKSIGGQFSGRDHSTIIHGLESHEDLTSQDSDYNKKFKELLTQLQHEYN